MDIDLPGASGIQACRRIKSEARFRDVPIVVITASTDMASLRQSFAVGASDYIPKPIHRVELLARGDSACRLKVEMDRRKERERELMEVKMGLQGANQELARANQELERLSRADALTGIANRRLFDEIFEREWDRARRNQSALSLALVDIDEFKLYNDTYGHQRGDACLRAVAQALDSQVRRSSDLVARYGGEEFAAILPGVGEKEALDMAWSLTRLVAEQQIEHESSRVSDRVTVSIGIATTIPSPEQTPKKLIAQADEALYRSKATGKNRVTHARDMAAETGPGAR
jgi:diguanylate cyclase (GGDEF)-like protein